MFTGNTIDNLVSLEGTNVVAPVAGVSVMIDVLLVVLVVVIIVISSLGPPG